MNEHFNWVEARVNRRRKRFPFRCSHLNEVCSWRIAFNSASKSSEFQTKDEEVGEEEEQSGCVGASNPEKSLAPFPLPNKLSAAFPPTFRQQIQLRFRR